VSVDGASCITPCVLNVRAGKHAALFEHPANHLEKRVPFDVGSTAPNSLVYQASHDGANIFKGVGYPLVVVGVLSLGIFTDTEESEFDEDTEGGREFYTVTFGALVVGAILLGIGEALAGVDRPEAVTEVKAEFTEEAPAYVPTSTSSFNEIIGADKPLMPKNLPVFRQYTGANP
jgi:hypothetical protein